MNIVGGYFIVPKYIQDFINYGKVEESIDITNEQMLEFVDLIKSGKFGIMNYKIFEAETSRPYAEFITVASPGALVSRPILGVMFGPNYIGVYLHEDMDKLVKIVI